MTQGDLKPNSKTNDGDKKAAIKDGDKNGDKSGDKNKKRRLPQMRQSPFIRYSQISFKR